MIALFNCFLNYSRTLTETANVSSRQLSKFIREVDCSVHQTDARSSFDQLNLIFIAEGFSDLLLVRNKDNAF